MLLCSSSRTAGWTGKECFMNEGKVWMRASFFFLVMFKNVCNYQVKKSNISRQQGNEVDLAKMVLK